MVPYVNGDIVKYIAKHTTACRCDEGVREILKQPIWMARDGEIARVDRDQYVGPDRRAGGIRIVFQNADGFYAASSDWCWAPVGHVRLVKRMKILEEN